ncbi:MAG: polysaccharide biosynthesis/export family protein [Thermoguttaceae bacterium]
MASLCHTLHNVSNSAAKHGLRWGVLVVLLLVMATSSGCVSINAFWDPKPAGTPAFRDVPKELARTPLPQYFLEPPDIITIDAINLVPRAPYILRVFDVLYVAVNGTPPDEPINGEFAIEPGGIINLGPGYGTVRVAGLSVREAEEAVRKHIRVSPDNAQGRVKDPDVSARLVIMSEIQKIAGQHMIGPDGYVTLGSYGRVYVQGLTIPECQAAIELHLSKSLEHPQVAVDVYSYNTKEYYVIFQARAGQELVFSFPYAGNETVLKAIANVQGLTPNASKRIWVARPMGNTNKPVILPVDWVAVTAYAMPQTNYQLLPGDRVYVVEERFVSADTVIARVIAPIERIFGFSLLGASTVTRFSGPVLQGGGARNIGTGGF